MFADVVVWRSVEGREARFSYAVPPEFVPNLAVGTRARVPFGKGTAMGVVWQLRDEVPELPTIRPLHAVIDALPPYTPEMLDIASWLSSHEIVSLAAVLRAMTPRHLRPFSPALALVADPDQVAQGHVPQGVRLRALWNRLQQRPLPKEALDAAERAAANRLVARGFAKWVERRPDIEATAVAGETLPPSPALTEEQQRAADAVGAAMASKRADRFLLQGVTGSGKTEVYLRLAEWALAQGRSALILLPEIALTPQMEQRFVQRLGARVVVWHSQLNEGERSDAFWHVRTQRAVVAVGVRSAVFLPFADLGLLVCDEEQEESYRQQESPHYDAREVAWARARYHHAPLLFGSATPSVETAYQVKQGRLKPLYLTARFQRRPLPQVQLVDLRKDRPFVGSGGMITQPLLDGLTAALDAGEQAMLLLNRRGYHAVWLCPSCGAAVRCPHCDVALTLHRRKQEDVLICHLCGYATVPPLTCSFCGHRMHGLGFGTQQLETVVQALLPNASVLRMDRDTMERKGAYARAIETFQKRQAQILIGTQMIAKGHDFPYVSFCGVIAADQALFLPDFRAAERTFQTLTQLAGRSGRGERPGHVVIQTYNPDHYAIRYAAQQDVEHFIQEELHVRQQTKTPPFWRLVMLRLVGEDQVAVQRVAAATAETMRQKMARFAEVLGPAPSYRARVEDRYRYQLIVRTRHLATTREAIEAWHDAAFATLRRMHVQAVVDMHPSGLL
ncbi:MAG: primosomal protein N' [Firmicutes bacterium]|nr:primosomal protein N' [Bacillota bacterium]